MISSRARELIEIGDRLFSARGSLDSHLQDVAEHFHPARADFTSQHTFGDDFASHLMTGFPAMQLRELADQLATMLRPRQKPWAKLVATNERVKQDTAARQWLEAVTEKMRRLMYADGALFLRATKVGDQDFVAFGQCVIELRMNRNRSGLLYLDRHLRDTVWCEDAERKLDTVHRKEKMTARTLCQYFPETVHKSVKKIKDTEPYKEFECRHIVVSSDMYDGQHADGKKYNREKFPFLSLYIDKENDTILEEVPRTWLGYIIPRWFVGPLGQYAVSPATMLGLPDSRLLQQMTVSLLEASEKAVNPPTLARAEVVRSDIQMFANGITWLDFPDEGKSVGDYLQTLDPDVGGMQHGLNMLLMVKEQIKEIMYLNKLNLPELGKDMTAFEVQQRISEYVRAALPLFEPMEVEYNGALCKNTFKVLLDNGAFGHPDTWPESLSGADVDFEFESPLQETANRSKLIAFQEMTGLIGMVQPIDPGAANEFDIRKALREAADGTQAPADWKRDPKQVEQLNKQTAERMAAQNAMSDVAQGAEIAGNAGKAAKEFAQAGAA